MNHKRKKTKQYDDLVILLGAKYLRSKQRSRKDVKMKPRFRVNNYLQGRKGKGRFFTRRTVENAFGILCARWLCLARTMFVNPCRAQLIVTACTVLHNYLCIVSKEDYTPPGFGDIYLEDGTVVDGIWRKNIPEGSFYFNEHDVSAGRPSEVAKATCDHLKNYFISIEGSVPWQNNSVLFPK